MTALAESPKPQIKELSNEALNKKMISVVKDAEIDKQLGEVEIFEKCKRLNKFDPALQSTDAAVNSKLNAAVDCFKQELGKGQDEKKLVEMAEKLNLQGYGLIQSKNIKDITKYLGNKMYKAMTGVDKEAADLKTTIANMRFNAPNRKLMDQRDFIDLYQTQLGKNALFEISRFCFEDFRLETATPNSNDNFSDHWKDFLSGSKKAEDYTVANVTDLGNTKAKFLPTGTNQDTIGDDIYKGIGQSLKTDKLSSFFTFCGEMIRPLCADLKRVGGTAETQAKATTISATNATTMTKGSKACVTQARLEGYRKAIAASAKLATEFDKMSSQDMALQLDKGATMQFYDQGKSNQKNSIDNLTNFSSKDILEGGLDKNVDYDKLKADCTNDPGKDECENFLAVDDSLKKAEHNLDMDILLKKEIQLARVRKAVSDSEKSVEEYLEQEGYLELLEEYKKDTNKAAFPLEERIRLIFEAKRVAALENLKKSIGSRQMTETEAKVQGSKAVAIGKNITESQDERARLAQVVLFNNIITSNLDLYSGPKGKEKKLGQNTNAWKIEVDSRSGKTSAKDPQLFQQLKTDGDNKKSVDTSGTSVVGLGMLDTILGAPKTP
jgi:hypothetical protein